MRRSSKLSLYIKASLIFLAVSFLFSSCKKDETDNPIVTSSGNSTPVTGKVTVTVNMLGEAFEIEGEVAPGASGASVNAGTMKIKEAVQHQVIPFNKDFNLVAELTPVSSNINNGVQSLAKGAEMSNLLQTDVDQGIKYKVVVYEYATGNYVTERNYVRGSEGSTDALNLDGGSKYTFIAYSVGSITDLPDITFDDSSAKNLNNSSFPVVLPNQAMYYRIDLQLTGGQTNYLNIVLKNKLSQITTTIDASDIGVITELTSAKILPTTNSLKIKLQDSTFIAYVPPGASIIDFLKGTLVVFPTLNTTIVTSTPTQICQYFGNSGTIIPSLGIGSITINGIQKTNITFDGININPGVKYNLNIKFKQIAPTSPTDNLGKVQAGWDLGTDDTRTPTW